MTVLILIFAEIIPKTIGTTHWKSLIGFAAVMIRALIVCLWPIVVSVEFIQKLITPKNSDNSISREEVGAMADVAEESGDVLVVLLMSKILKRKQFTTASAALLRLVV